MALFKIAKGLESRLPSAKVEGHCYVANTSDKYYFYVDVSNTNRVKLSAKYAEEYPVTVRTWTKS